MPRRLRVLRDPVTIELDGEVVEAERGEPIAAALIAAGKIALARSPKFHRPRGPSCMRAACDGCLARVNDVPNVMTCMVAAEQGTVVRTQNTLGSREVDLLRMTDWFFPKGMNHHELFAGVPGVQQIMQTFARRVAGLGKLPAEAVAPRASVRREVDVLVIGAGPAGMAVAAKAARSGRSVEIVEDALEIGGGVRALGAADAAAWRAIEADFRAARARVRTSTTAAAIFGDDVLVVDAKGAEIVTARATVIAAGAHDGALAFEGNDVPGVMSARAAGWLLARGVSLGARVGVVIDPANGSGPFGEAFARARLAAGEAEAQVVRGTPLRVDGSSAVKGATVRDASGGEGRLRHLKVDALVIDAPRAPAYELCEQAGAALEHAARGYIPKLVRGRIRDGFFALGEVAGGPFEPAAMLRAADEIVAQL
jgi:sarcosine oxidase subunit alpha